MTVTLDSLLTRSPDVCGGRLRLAGTRVTVHQIVVLYKNGSSPEEIAGEYPLLTLAQVYAALFYYHANRDEVEAALAEEHEESERLERQHLDLDRQSA